MKAETAVAATGFSPGAEGGEHAHVFREGARREGGGRGSSEWTTHARTHGLTAKKQWVGRAAADGGGVVAVVIPCPGNSILPPLPLSLRRCWPKTTRVQCHERGRGRCTRATNPPPAPPTQTDGSSSHYDAALHTSREATAAAAAVRNSCVAPVNILRWRPTVQEGVRGGDGEDETILSCRAPRSDAT